MYNILDCDPCILMYYCSNICANTWLYYVMYYISNREVSVHISPQLKVKCISLHLWQRKSISSFNSSFLVVKERHLWSGMNLFCAGGKANDVFLSLLIEYSWIIIKSTEIGCLGGHDQSATFSQAQTDSVSQKTSDQHCKIKHIYYDSVPLGVLVSHFTELALCLNDLFIYCSISFALSGFNFRLYWCGINESIWTVSD